jgi:hypothetical protein
MMMVEETVEDRRGDGAVIVENGGPLLERFVGGQHDGTAFVAAAAAGAAGGGVRSVGMGVTDRKSSSGHTAIMRPHSDRD